ncbi:type I restriction enzyme HsdR N-terminal domain-containing protein [Bosea sp. 47.2.35]|uniref:type I restriction enzyme HsdR N-terminal domain-containing protein n=1 Tax=Bosea sp. 47.2.35 TaxID=2969304 RepID=UPI0021501275|nr:type I restriction enzyme HsdR N-terminal domain-containing protein [Bosea sp. 47.2.35]MCR4524625.1 type I restriction enzyme HsdR N-terminal domain-containing protein [Bosea sp. 47.2.35]
MEPDFGTMNETDVREILVRPLLDRLGYKHGTSANIRTEVTLRYASHFLGRKNPKNDPPLVGRADYVCDATSYGRWVVEVKAPQHALTQDDVEQAHTYSAHPEIAASYFLLTNGREYRLYATGKLDAPVLAWVHADTEKNILNLFNVVSYEALKKLAHLVRPDPGKPLGRHLPSRLQIVGGDVRYGEHHSNHPLMQNVNAISGTIAAVIGGTVGRADDGRLHAVVSIRSPFQELIPLLRAAGMESFEFFSASEHFSDSIEQPTILQNVTQTRVDRGLRIPLMRGGPELALPFGFESSVYTEATGYVDKDRFCGALAFSYQYRFFDRGRSGIPQLDMLVASSPPVATLDGEGTFDLRFVPDR